MQMLENVNVSTGEARELPKKAPQMLDKVPKKAYNAMAQPELEMRRTGRLSSRLTFLVDYVGFYKARRECTDY